MITTEQYQMGLLKIQDSLKNNHKDFLLNQYYSKNKIISSRELANLSSLNMVDANRMYGRLGHLLADALSVYPSKRNDGTYRWWQILSSGIRATDTHGFLWKMHTELARALEILGWVTLQAENIFPDEIDSSDLEIYQEGAKFQVIVNAYERNPAARKKCIEVYGTQCYVCGFDFELTYGALGSGFIHVHHEKPLSLIEKTHNVDPKEDLKPLCPNCHAMIHRTKPALSVEELKQIIRNKNNDIE